MCLVKQSRTDEVKALAYHWGLVWWEVTRRQMQTRARRTFKSLGADAAGIGSGGESGCPWHPLCSHSSTWALPDLAAILLFGLHNLSRSAERAECIHHPKTR